MKIALLAVLMSILTAAGLVAVKQNNLLTLATPETQVAQATPSAPCDSVTQYGITWNFVGAHTCGQFVNGDWWVVGPVTIQSVSPTPSGGTNGSMINPVSAPVQAYDNRGLGYDASAGVTFPQERAD